MWQTKWRNVRLARVSFPEEGKRGGSGPKRLLHLDTVNNLHDPIFKETL
jgi:hypothetical protein